MLRRVGPCRPRLYVDRNIATSSDPAPRSGSIPVFTEFDNVIETPVGRFENDWDASSFNVFVGMMVYPFK